MKKTDLRIGNRVMFDGKECTVTGIYPLDEVRLSIPFQALTYIIKIKEVEGVKLTHEWLEENNIILDDKPLNSGCYIEWFDTSFGLVSVDTDDLERPILYVHEMQNIYHAYKSDEIIEEINSMDYA